MASINYDPTNRGFQITNLIFGKILPQLPITLKGLKILSLSYFEYYQSWLNNLMDNCHPSNITKLRKINCSYIFIWYLVIFFHTYFQRLGQNTFKGGPIKNYHEKLETFLFFPFETMVIMESYSFITHINVKKLKLKIHLIQFRFQFN